MKRYKHNLSYYNLMTCDMGRLCPIGLVEALPGDTFQHHTNVVIRVSPLAAPVMHSVTARVHHFFVPHRLVWDGWEDFITAGPDGTDAQTIPQIPVLQSGHKGTLPDYFGVPVPGTGGAQVSALPFRAFNMIYNEWYRDQDLCTERTEDDLTTPLIAWEKDYFTAARPWSQKGPDVTIPILDTAPVVAKGAGDGSKSSYWTENEFVYTQSAGPQFETDLTSATAASVNDWRRAFAIQRYQEARARYGSRYTEYLRYLGVRPKDERLQRPEFLGGGTAQVQFSEVLQTANDTTDEKAFGVGDMYGHGIAAMRSNKYRRTIEEHGYVISLLSVRPKTVYTKALDRTWLKRTREEFFQKELQHIGQQEIWEAEVFFGTEANRYNTFGYQDRYSEHRHQFSKVCGDFRDTLNYWHMGREFATPPTLNSSFVECDATKRIHNEQSQHALWVMCQHKIGARRLVDRSAYSRIY